MARSPRLPSRYFSQGSPYPLDKVSHSVRARHRGRRVPPLKEMHMSIDVAILGAGPYGLSVASHLRARGIDFRIFGRPMQSWRAHMPIGMHLKSEGFATNLSDPSA